MDDRNAGAGFGNLLAACWYRLAWLGNLAAVLFNTGFALLAIFTLGGIVFITRPQQVMQDIPPWLWLPLLVVMAPAEIYSMYLAWSTIFSGKMPTGPAIAVRQRRVPAALRFLIAAVWFANFIVGAAIVGSLSKPHGGQPVTTGEIALILVVTLLLTFPANIYLCLAVKTISDDPKRLARVWRWRLAIDLLIAIGAAAYYA